MMPASYMVSNKASPKHDAGPLISVIIPFYGVEFFIAECLESVLAQDLTDIEVICVDDQSPDRSRAIVEFYAAKDARISIVTHQTNKGLGPARNTGVKHAQGDYLLFLDSDDRLSWPGALRALANLALTSACEVIAGSARALDINGDQHDWDIEFQRSYPDRVLETLSGSEAYDALIRIPGSYYLPLRSWGILINRDFYASLSLSHPAGPHEDLGHNALMCSAASSVAYSNVIVVDYRQRNNSISRSRWTAERMTKYMGVWYHFRDEHARFGQSHNVSNAALHLIRNALWMLERNNVLEADREAVLDMLQQIAEDMKDLPNPEMMAQVSIIMAEVLPKIGVSQTETATRRSMLTQGQSTATARFFLRR